MHTPSDSIDIGDIAAATGLRPSALRYYEEQGLIRPVARIRGRRHYDRSTLRRLSVIALCQEVGFTITEIGELLGHRKGGRERWRRLAERKLAEIDAHIEKAHATRRLLQETLACGCGDPTSCDMITGATERRLHAAGGKRTLAPRLDQT